MPLTGFQRHLLLAANHDRGSGRTLFSYVIPVKCVVDLSLGLVSGDPGLLGCCRCFRVPLQVWPKKGTWRAEGALEACIEWPSGVRAQWNTHTAEVSFLCRRFPLFPFRPTNKCAPGANRGRGEAPPHTHSVCFFSRGVAHRCCYQSSSRENHRAASEGATHKVSVLLAPP